MIIRILLYCMCLFDCLTEDGLKGAIGDRINLLMAACAWNLKQWLLAIFLLFFRARNVQIAPV